MLTIEQIDELAKTRPTRCECTMCAGWSGLIATARAAHVYKAECDAWREGVTITMDESGEQPFATLTGIDEAVAVIKARAASDALAAPTLQELGGS